MEKKDMSGVRACPIGGVPKSEIELNNRRFHLLERKIDELSNIIINLQKRLLTLESRSQSTDDPFMYPPPTL